MRHVPLKETHLKLRTFAGEPVEPMGFFKVTFQYKGQSKEVPIYVMKNEGPIFFLVWSWCLATPYCERRGAAYWLHIPVFVRNKEKYSQFEKEDLSLVWGVKKFQSYLEGRHFTLVTSNQPPNYIMDPRKAVPVTAAARIQRWCLLLAACSYQIEFLGTKNHAICDGLSRLPQPQAPAEKSGEVEMFDTCVVESRPVTDQELRIQAH